MYVATHVHFLSFLISLPCKYACVLFCDSSNLFLTFRTAVVNTAADATLTFAVVNVVIV